MSLFSQSCAEATRLISDAQDSTLSSPARVGLRLHLMICRHCRRYDRQIQLIQSLFTAYPQKVTPAELPDEFRNELVHKLKQIH